MIDDQQIFDGSVSLISTYLSHMFEIFCLISKLLNIRQYSTLVILVLLQSHFLSSDWIRFALFIFATSDICNTTCYFYCNVFLNHVEKLLISYAASISFNLKVILKGIVYFFLNIFKSLWLQMHFWYELVARINSLTSINMGGYAWEALIQFTVAIKFTINLHQTLFPVNINEFI